MASQPVIAPHLRLWHNAGLEFLLAPEALAKAPLLQSASAQARAPQTPSSPKAAQSIQSTPKLSPATQQRAVKPQHAVSVQSPAAPPATPRIPLSQWPENWRAALEHLRTRTPSPTIAWTYQQLGEDLHSNTPSAQRRALLGRFLKDLHCPAGTHAFWPVSLPDDNNIPAPSLFWSGIHEMRARILILMGSHTMRAVELPFSLRPLQQCRYNNCLIWIVRDINVLAEAEEHYRETLTFLQNSLRAFGK